MNELNKLGGSEAVLKVRRGQENIDIKMNPIETEDGSYKLGSLGS